MMTTAAAGADRRRIAEQAAEWIVALTGDDAADRAAARAGFDAWRQADPRHAAAAQRMEAMLGRLDACANRPARAALATVPPTPAMQVAKHAAKLAGARTGAAALAVALLAGAAALGLPGWRSGALLADLRTGTGQWQTRVLEDGSRVTLNSGSAIDLRFTAGQREVTLLRGEVLVDVARDPARPFLVRTAEARIRALGTRFVVERGDQGTDLTMLESKTEVRAARDDAAAPGSAPTSAPTLANAPARVVAAGEKVRITAAGVGPAAAIDPASVDDAWRDHRLVVRGRPLAEVLDELARHRPGAIRYDAGQLAAMRVTAVLPLDDTDRALHLLLSSFPALRIRTVTPYLVLVDAPRP